MLSHRIIWTACLILALGLAGSAVHADLVGHWPLDEGQGTVAFDATDNGNDGALRGDPQWVPGVSKSALQFDADDDVDCGNAPILNLTGPLSIAVWIKADRDESAAIAPLSKATSGAAGWAWQLRYGWNSPQPYMGFQFNATGNRVWVYAQENLVLGEWYHMAAAHDGSVVKCYVNGAETDSAAMGSLIGGADAPFYIGQDGWNDNWEGALDDVRLYDHGLSPAEVIAAMLGSPPELASDPMPENEAVDVLRDGLLAWAPGEFAGTHNLYLGTSFEDVNSATEATVSGLDVNSFDPGRLDFDQTYFWRVDEVNATPDKTVFKGNVWSFTAEPYSIQVPGDTITVTASSASNEFSQPVKVINGSGLGEGNTHSASPEDMWFTATVDLDPWIQFEFDGVRQLDTMKVWNSNGAAESALGWGVKDVEIAYSVDGETWAVLADATQFSRAPGLATYDTFDTIAFGGVAAKYVRFNIISNWGGILMSYSLSEVQFSMIPAAARQPDPADGAGDVLPNATATWRAGREAAQHTLFIGPDMNAVADGSAPSVDSSINSVDLSAFDLQMEETYYWRVDEVNEAEATPVWAGPVWSFTTAAALVVDDFEGYGNDSPDRPFQAWLDGFGYSADEYFPVEYPGNGTGAGIGHDIWSLTSPHYNGDIMETGSTLPDSGQSMPFYYTNSGGVSSETQRKFSVAQDWTVGGAITLSIPFRGQAGNTGTLYAKINGTKVVYAGNLAVNGWLAFNIDLTGLDVQSVTELAIGVDGSSASGMLLIDDVTLRSVAGETVAPEDPGSNGLVGAWNLDEGSGTTTADNSGNGHTGTIVGATWDTGMQGAALLFAASDYVETGYAGPAGTTSRTCSSWIKTVEANRTIMSWGLNTSGKKWRVRLDATGGLRVEVNGGYHFGQAFLADDEWHHVAVVLEDDGTPDVSETLLYVDGLSEATSALQAKGVDTDPAGEVRIGLSAYHTSGFMGLIDEARIYDRALSEAEILSLAGMQDPIDKPF